MLLVYVSLVWQNGCDVTVSMISNRISVRCYFLRLRFQLMRFSDVTFSVTKFHIMKRKWCDISGCHSGVSEDLFFFWWCDVFLGRCYPTFRYIHVTLCSYLTSRRRIWLFEHWRWRHYDPLKHEELLTKRNFVISRKTWNSSSHVSENLWYYGRVSVCSCCPDFLRHWQICMHMLAIHPIILRIRWLCSA